MAVLQMSNGDSPRRVSIAGTSVAQVAWLVSPTPHQRLCPRSCRTSRPGASPCFGQAEPPHQRSVARRNPAHRKLPERPCTGPVLAKSL